MKKVLSMTLLLLTLGSLCIADEAPKGAKPALYDEKANASQQIAKALSTAKSGRKNVMLQFGANWCGWCHKLHDLCASDRTIAAELKKSYVVVLVDVNNNHNADIVKRYDNPTRFGLPVIVVLDKDGKALTTQDTGKLESGDHHDPAKVLAFLRQWVPKK